MGYYMLYGLLLCCYYYAYFLLFQGGDRVEMSVSDVYRRQILTSKLDSRAERVNMTHKSSA